MRTKISPTSSSVASSSWVAAVLRISTVGSGSRAIECARSEIFLHSVLIPIVDRDGPCPGVVNKIPPNLWLRTRAPPKFGHIARNSESLRIAASATSNRPSVGRERDGDLSFSPSFSTTSAPRITAYREVRRCCPSITSVVARRPGLSAPTARASFLRGMPEDEGANWKATKSESRRSRTFVSSQTKGRCRSGSAITSRSISLTREAIDR